MSSSKKILPFLCLLIFSGPVYAEQDQSYYQRGVTSFQQGQYANAASELEAHNRLYPDDLKGLHVLAEVYLNLDKTSLALVTLDAAHKLERNNRQTHLLKGRLYLQAQQPEKARAHFRTLVFLEKADAEVYFGLAQAELLLNQNADAQKAIENAQKDRSISPDVSARILLLKAQLYPEQEGQFLQSAQLITGLSPGVQERVQQSWVTYLIQNGRVRELFEAKEADIKAKLSDNSESDLTSDFKTLHAYLSAASSDADERFFLKILENLNESYPQNVGLRQELLRNYIHLQRYEYLLSFYQWELVAFSKRWDDATRAAAFHRLADVHLRLGGVKLAFDNYQRAVEIAPTDALARRRLGVIYLSAGDSASAQKEFITVLQQDPLDRKARLLFALSLAYAGNKTQAKEVLTQLPADYGGELRERVLAILVLPNPRPEPSLWSDLIADEEILNEHQHLLSKITFKQ